MTDHDDTLRDSWQPGRSMAESWGPYCELFFPPRRVTSWTYFKRITTGANVVHRLWDQREELRRRYEAAHGSDPDQWPHRHPGVVLDAVEWVAHAACLRCQWLDDRGTSMRDSGWHGEAMAIAVRHQDSGGQLSTQ